jgi:hypothetical protein
MAVIADLAGVVILGVGFFISRHSRRRPSAA